MRKETCENCRYWRDPEPPVIASGSMDGNAKVCAFNPPTTQIIPGPPNVAGDPTLQVLNIRPMTAGDDMCSNHAARFEVLNN